MDYLLILIFFALMAPMYFLYTKNIIFTRFIIDSDLKQKLNKMMTKFFKEKNMEEYQPYDYTHISVMDKQKNIYTIDVWTRKRDLDNENWDSTSKLFTVILNKTGDEFELIDIKEKQAWDLGQIIPENSSNFLRYSQGFPNIVREYLGSLRQAHKNVQWADITTCEKGGSSSSTICKDSEKITIGDKNEVLTYPKHKVLENPEEKKFECELMIPEKSEFIIPNGIINMKCHERLDQDNTHWIAEDNNKRDDYSQFEQNKTTLVYNFDSKV